ncbi:MAG: hypothetical protein HQL57_11850, partial [Magnetococcales bacterium]|nr:hypothetical protein [Magnetococcales bacterium]
PSVLERVGLTPEGPDTVVTVLEVWPDCSMNTDITIQVMDDAGDPIQEGSTYASTENDLRVALITRPHGGETVSGVNASGTTVSSSASDNFIYVRTTNGSVTLNLKSGRYPGVVELKVQALKAGAEAATQGKTESEIEAAGLTLASATSSQITISSGPPQSIIVSEPRDSALVNMSQYGLSGAYCLIGTALVTDQHGNAVPDGTVLSLGLMDQVIAQGTNGSVTAGSKVLGADGAAFDTGGVDPDGDGISRKLKEGDRLVIYSGVGAGDKNRFLASSPAATSATVNASFSTTAASLPYYMGSALVGGAIHGYKSSSGCDPTSLVSGTTTTTGGLAPFRVTYPANRETIRLGCFGYSAATGAYSTLDSRYPNSSGQVLLVVAANDSSATAVTRGKFCFNGLSPLSLTPTTKTLSKTGTYTVEVEVMDAGKIPLPFQEVSCEFSIGTKSSATFDVAVAYPAGYDHPDSTNGITDLDGIVKVSLTVTGGGGAEADTGTVTCTSGGYSGAIAINVP